MAYRMIQVGTGGFGRAWCERFLPPNVEDGLIEVVAAVDVNPEALANARPSLGLPTGKCYTDINKAFDENKADFATVVVPPRHHEAVVDVILSHDMHVLSEKPIADTLEAAVRIARKVKDAGKKMGVTMSHRFDQDKTTLREEIRSGRHGELDYVICRFTCDCRRYGTWGAFRYEIPDALMVEGSVHHLDLLVDMAGARADALYAQTWTPRWGEFKGDSQGHVMIRCENGKRVFYEGAKNNAVGLNGWANEYIRAECERSTLALSHRRLECFRHGEERRDNVVEGQGEEIPLIEQPKWSNAWLIEKFVRWLDGGEPMETNIEDNLQSVALIFGAVESSHAGEPVKVQEFLQAARGS